MQKTMHSTRLKDRHAPVRSALATALSLAFMLGACAQTPSHQPGAPTMAQPAGPQSLTFSANGQSVAYLKRGSGPALVIVHGLGGHKEDFAAVMAQLSHGHTVYAFDMLGFGASSRSAPSVGPGAQADVIAALIRHERLSKANVMGNSAGAWAAATFAAKYPTMINKLILSDAAGLKITLSGPPPVSFAPTTEQEMDQLLRAVILSDFARSPEFVAHALEQFKASGEAASLGKLFADFQAPGNTDKVLDDVLPGVRAPTLVIWGAKDGLFPPALANVVSGGIEGSKVVLIPNASHFPHIDNPDAVTTAVASFIDG